MRILEVAAVIAIALMPLERAAAQPAQDESERLFKSIDWLAGPDVGRLGDEAQVQIPGSCRFTQAAGARSFMLVTENPPSGNEQGVLLCQSSTPKADTWFVVFSYDASGYVRDDEGKTLDAAKILSTLRTGNEQGNEERRRRGWAPITIDSWVRVPFYDSRTNNLTWSLRIRSEGNAPAVNHSVRLLGRGGVMHADLVVDDQQLASVVPSFDSIVTGFSYATGRKYAEWRQGDKLASYGLTALVAGGAGAVAVKMGLFGKLWKLVVVFFAAAWKVMAVAVVALWAKLRSFFSRKAAPTP